MTMELRICRVLSVLLNGRSLGMRYFDVRNDVTELWLDFFRFGVDGDVEHLEQKSVEEHRGRLAAAHLFRYVRDDVQRAAHRWTRVKCPWNPWSVCPN